MVIQNHSSVEVEEEQALYFRARRAHLVGPGARNPVQAAFAILGAQAQQEGPALFALSQRTEGRPTASALKRRLLDAGSRRLVRTWGQRDTLHIYDSNDWPTIVGARKEWPQSGRSGAMPSDADVAAFGRVFEKAGGPLLRRDLNEFIPQRYIDQVEEHPYAGPEPIRLAATRLIWRLAMAGKVCFAHKVGSEQAYVHRKHWLADLPWPKKLDPLGAATELARRYLAVYAPATPADVAHFFGARVGSVKTWLERLDSELVTVVCGVRKGQLALRDDLTLLQKSPPMKKADWPVRLLPKWDTHLMTHKDKSWVTPHTDETPLVWRKAADISATVLARGRIVATWSHRATGKRLIVKVNPLKDWRKLYQAAVKREARALAVHLEVPQLEIEIAKG